MEVELIWSRSEPLGPLADAFRDYLEASVARRAIDRSRVSDGFVFTSKLPGPRENTRLGMPVGILEKGEPPQPGIQRMLVSADAYFPWKYKWWRGGVSPPGFPHVVDPWSLRFVFTGHRSTEWITVRDYQRSSARESSRESLVLSVDATRRFFVIVVQMHYHVCAIAQEIVMPRSASVSQESARTTAPVASAEWARRINRMLREQLDDSAGARPSAAQTDVLTPGEGCGVADAIHFSGSAAETLVRLGLKASLLAELASTSAIDAKDLHEFAGIDRTTVSRRSARGDVLPQEVAVKAIEFAQLVATAADVFGSVADASRWLTRPHPALDAETPLRRARTPWGLEQVRSMLGALKYGAPV